MTFFRPLTPERTALVRAQDDRHREREALTRDHVCGVCGGLLGIRKWWDGWPMLFCMADNTHQGYRRQPLDKWTARTIRERERMRREK